MKKIKINFYFVMCLMVTFLIASCSNTSSSLEMVPKSSPYVSIVNIGSLLKKGHMDSMEKLKEFKFFKKIKRFASEDRQFKKIYKAIEEDPSVTGVDFSSDLVTFVHAISKREVYFCNAFELDDSDKFEDFVKDLVRRSKNEYDIVEEDDLNYMIIGSEDRSEMIISWDNDRALVALSTSRRVSLDIFKGEVEDMMTLKSDKNITNDDSFSDFLDNKKDVSVWFSIDNFDDSIGASSLLRSFYYLPREVRGEVSKFFGKEICFSMHLNFDNENIKLTTNISPEESLKEFDIYNGDFNSDILKYLPNNSYFVSGVSLDVNKLHDYVVSNRQYLRVLDDIAEQLKVDGDTFVNSLGGSAVFNVHGYEKVEYSYLGYGYGFNESKAKKFDKLYPIGDVDSLSEEDIEKLNKGETISVIVKGKTYEGYELVESCGLVNGNEKLEEIPVEVTEAEDADVEVMEDEDADVEVMEDVSFRATSRNEYSMNIKNILAKGGTVETAIKNNSLVNFYDGGMEYGRNVKQTRETDLPLYAFVMDLKDSKVMMDIFNSKDFSQHFTKYEGYYSFNRELAYVSFKENILLLTNDIKVVESFKTGGFSDNLGDSSLATSLKNNPFYSNMNLDYDTYSDKVKMAIESELRGGIATKVSNLVFDFAKNVELRTIDKANSELIINTQNTDENSFYNLIKTIDKLTNTID